MERWTTKIMEYWNFRMMGKKNVAGCGINWKRDKKKWGKTSKLGGPGYGCL
jgi:hypothetical protein